MVKVAIIKSHLSRGGGLEKVTEGLLKSFSTMPAQITLVTTDIARIPNAPIEVVQLGYRSKFSLYHCWQFERMVQEWLKLYPQDIVLSLDRHPHQHYYRAGSGVHAAYLARRASLLPRWKQFCLYQNPLHRFLLRQEREAYASSQLKLIVTNSNMIKKELEQWYQVPSNRIQTIFNGVDFDQATEDFCATRQSGPIRFLFIGNGYERKGLPFILRALPWLSSYCFELHVVGKGNAVKHAPKNVFFHGYQSSMKEWYQKSDVLLSPSLYDPSANVVVEALAMGLFVVISSSNGASELLTPSTGIVVDAPEDPVTMAEALRLALALRHNREEIRNSVRHLDFQGQLDQIVQTIWADHKLNR